VTEYSGLVINKERKNALTQALTKLNCGGVEGAVSLLNQGQTRDQFIRQLVEELVVGETYFFRERITLDQIDWSEVTQASSVVSIWCAGCSTGEEAYTLAVLASEALGPNKKVRVVATDISVEALKQAETGSYSERSVQRVPDSLKAKYFHTVGNRYCVTDQLKSAVSFEQVNLVNSQVPEDFKERFQLVVCRNVLIYFNHQTSAAVLHTLESSLSPGGFLLLGTADRLVKTNIELASLEASSLNRSSFSVKKVIDSDLLEDALDDFEQSDLEAAEVKSKVTRAYELTRQGQLEEAQKLAVEAAKEDPLCADAVFVQGSIALNMLDAISALKAFRRSLYLDPSFSQAAFRIGLTYEATGDTEAALKAYRHAIDIYNSPGHNPERKLLGLLDSSFIEECRSRVKDLA